MFRSMSPHPLSSIDLDCASGDHIPIEERSGLELTEFKGKQITPKGIATFNPGLRCHTT